MALPKIQSAVHTLTIPSTNKPIKYRGFTVREQKALLIAQTSSDIRVLMNTLKEVIKSCVLDKVNVDDLAIFDVEYIFTQIRAISVGEIVNLSFACDKCQEETQLTFDLTKLKVEVDPKYNKTIPLFDSVGIVLKYPSLEVLDSTDNADDIEIIFDIILKSIDYIYDADEIHYAKEQTQEELTDFIESLSTMQFAKIEEFFKNLPKLQQKVIWDCPKCGQHHDKIMEGLKNFF